MKNHLTTSLLIVSLTAFLGLYSISQAAEKPTKLTKKSNLDPRYAQKFPTAWNLKKGQVISPFKPHNVLDVSHLRAGMLARDPFTAKVNKETGKPDINTALIFRVPAPNEKPANAQNNQASR